MFGKHLWDYRSLLEALPLLDGSTLVCHCALAEACHADIIIEAFEKMRSSDLAALEGPPPEDQEIHHESSKHRAVVKHSAIQEN